MSRAMYFGNLRLRHQLEKLTGSLFAYDVAKRNPNNKRMHMDIACRSLQTAHVMGKIGSTVRLQEGGIPVPVELAILSLTEVFAQALRTGRPWAMWQVGGNRRDHVAHGRPVRRDRKSTRLNSSHVAISNAVSCLNKNIL